MSGDDYPEIDTIWKRYGKKGLIAPGEYARPEFEYLAGCPWGLSEKLDGTNVRITYQGDPDAMQGTPWRAVGGRSKDAAHPVSLQDAVYTLTKNAPWESQFGDNETHVVLYGEGVGAPIREGSAYGSECSFVLFDVFVDGWWLSREDVEDVASNFGVVAAPEVGVGTLADACDMVRKGFPSKEWNIDRVEGLVLRPVVELHDRKNKRIMTKIKYNDYERLAASGTGAT